MINKKITPRLAFFIVVGLVTMASMAKFVNTFIFRTNAAQSKVTADFAPATGTLGDSPFRIVLKPVSTAEKVSGVDVALSIQNGTLTSWSPCKSIDEGTTPVIKPLVENIGATPRYSCVVLDKDVNLVSGLVVSGAVQCSGTAPVIISLDTVKSQVSGPVEGGLYAFNPVQNVTYTCTGAGATPTPVPSDISAEFEPTTCKGDKGSSCNYALTLKSNDGLKKISGYYVKVAFDKSILKGKAIASPASVKGLLAQVVAPTPPSAINNPPIVAPTATPIPGVLTPTVAAATPTPGSNDVTPGLTATPTVGLTATPALGTPTPTVVAGTPSPQPPKEATCSMVNTDVDNEKGIMTMLYVCDSASTDLKTSLTSTLTFDSIAEGEGTLTISEVQVVGPQALGGLYSVNKGTAKYIIGQGGGNVDVKLKLRMQGIVKKPSKRDSMQVRVGVGDGGLAEPVYKTVEFKSDDNGHFNGTASFNLPTRKDYKLLVKCEHCLQRKVCDKDAKEEEAASYSCDKGKVELKNGSNNFDLSGIVQLACDIPAGKQDGVCNSADFALVRNLLGKTDDDAIRKADLNFDGIVNAIDFSLMTAARINIADVK